MSALAAEYDSSSRPNRKCALRLSVKVVRVLLLALLFTSTALRILWALQEPDLIVPDEMTFSDLARHIAAGGDWRAWSSDWGASVFPQAMLLVLPSSFLIDVGLDPLAATRIISILYGSATVLIMMLLWLIVDRKAAGQKPIWLPTLGLLILMFLPSHTLWSSLALRESAIEFWTVLTIFGASLVMANPKFTRWWFVGLGIVALGTIALTPMRVGAAVIIGLSIIAGAMWPFHESPRVMPILGTVAAIALFLGPHVTSMLISQVKSPTPGLANTEIVAAPKTTSETTPETTPPIEATPTRIGAFMNSIAAQRVGRQAGAASALSANSCYPAQPFGSQLTCEIKRFPGALMEVSLRPLWPVDAMQPQSATRNSSSVENLLWIALFLFTAFILATRIMRIPRLAVVVIAYLLMHISMMAIAEGNLGTAFRHKSTTLLVFATLLILAGGRRILPIVR